MLDEALSCTQYNAEYSSEDEASAFFQITKSTIVRWTKPESTERIIEQVGGDNSYCDATVVFICQ